MRPADWRDIPAMGALERAAFVSDPWDETSLWAELAMRPRRYYLVATAAEEAPAPVLAYAGADLGGEVADVMTVAVHPDARGQGLGALLLDRLHQRARTDGAGTMALEVRADNAVARRLYAGRGYQVIRTRAGYYRSDQGEAVDALVLQKSLIEHDDNENQADEGRDRR